MARSHLALFLVFLLAIPLWAKDDILPGDQVVSLGKLEQVEGILEIVYQGPHKDKAFRVDRKIEFRFSKPFRLWVKDSLGNLQIAMDTESGYIHDPSHQRVIRISLASVLGNRWARFVLATLDFGSLLDPQKMPQLRKTFQLHIHHGPAPPDSHGLDWKATIPKDGKAKAGDWLIMTPEKTSLYSRFFGLGRVALHIGSKLAIPTEFRYFQRREDASFTRTVTVSIPRLEFNKKLKNKEYQLVVPSGTITVEATDLLLALIIERIGVMWQRVKETFNRIGQEFVPQKGGKP